MTSKFAASQTNIDSRVVRVTPPKLHLLGEDLYFLNQSYFILLDICLVCYLIKASGSLESSFILTLSPKIEPK